MPKIIPFPTFNAVSEPCAAESVEHCIEWENVEAYRGETSDLAQALDNALFQVALRQGKQNSLYHQIDSARCGLQLAEMRAALSLYGEWKAEHAELVCVPRRARFG